MFITSFAEVLSLGAVVPFLSVLTNPKVLFEYKRIQYIIKIFDISKPEELLLPLTLVFCITVIIAAIMRFIMLWAQTRLSFAIGSDFSYSIYKKTLYQPYSVHISRNSSEVITGVSTKVDSLINNALLPSLIIISSSLMLFMVISALFLLNPLIAFFTFFGFGFIYVIIIQIVKKKLHQDSINISIELTKVVKALQEGLGGIRDVIIDGTQQVYCDVYKNADQPLKKAQASMTIISNSPRFGIEALGMILIALVAYFATVKSNGLITAVPLLGIIAVSAQRMLPVLQQLYASWVAIKGGELSLQDALKLISQPMIDETKILNFNSISFAKEIELKEVSFKYNSSSNLVLNNLNLMIPKGSVIGIVGETGSGKSTMLDILLGLLEPTSGNLLVDGLIISDVNRQSWQKHIAHVPQNIYLSDATILENIAFGVPQIKIDIDKAYEAASKAQIFTSIDAMPEKFNTMVGERGIRLSGGQKQRIGIARAFYKNAHVIIFDEATSALDNNTENIIMDSIENLSKELTIIIVAHRTSTLKNCDKIIEISNGRINKIGNYREFLF